MARIIQFGIACVSVVASTVIQVQGASISTLFASDNGGGEGGGIYFDVNVLSPAGITIESISTNTDATFTNGQIYIYTRPGTYSGFETSTAGWTLVSSGTGNSAGSNNPSVFVVSNFFLAQANTGIAIVSESGVWGHQYTNGNGSNQFYSNSDLSLTFGSATNTAFSGGIFSPRVWNGIIQYSMYLPPNSSGYWDINGSTFGAGGTSPHGSWQEANWSTSPDGISQTLLWTNGADANFSAGNDATGQYTIDLDAPVIVRDLSVEDGQVTIAPTANLNNLTFTDPRDGESIITTGDNSLLALNTDVLTSGNLAKTGAGQVNFNAPMVIDGIFSVHQGTVNVNSSLVSVDTDNSGALTVNGTLTSPVDNSGFLGGSGLIKGNVQNVGIIHLGIPLVS